MESHYSDNDRFCDANILQSLKQTLHRNKIKGHLEVHKVRKEF
jgi:hypothetical protein